MNGSPCGCRSVIVYVFVPLSIVGTQTYMQVSWTLLFHDRVYRKIYVVTVLPDLSLPRVSQIPILPARSQRTGVMSKWYGPSSPHHCMVKAPHSNGLASLVSLDRDANPLIRPTYAVIFRLMYCPHVDPIHPNASPRSRITRMIRYRLLLYSLHWSISLDVWCRV